MGKGAKCGCIRSGVDVFVQLKKWRRDEGTWIFMCSSFARCRDLHRTLSSLPMSTVSPHEPHLRKEKKEQRVHVTWMAEGQARRQQQAYTRCLPLIAAVQALRIIVALPLGYSYHPIVESFMSQDRASGCTALKLTRHSVPRCLHSLTEITACA